MYSLWEAWTCHGEMLQVGFPPSFKPKGKNFMVNQVNAQEAYADKDSTSAYFPFTQEQCQQFFTMLGTQMQAVQLNIGDKDT